MTEETKKNQIRKFRDRWQAVSDIEIEEQKSATIALRWQQLNAIYSMAKGMGLPLEKSNEDDIIIYQRLVKLRVFHK